MQKVNESISISGKDSITTPTIGFKENVLTPGRTYMVKVIIKGTGDPGVYAMFKFTVNLGPYGGFCVLKAKFGSADIGKFFLLEMFVLQYIKQTLSPLIHFGILDNLKWEGVDINVLFANI